MRATNRVRRLVVLLAAAAFACADQAGALRISNRYSPENRNRALRQLTRYIILHTTEGPARGSLAKVRRNGECHYFVGLDGQVYRVIHRNRVALHAGRSMWQGKTDLDQCSLGIEVVGYHNRDINAAQYRALKDLLADLQRIYKIPDDRVLTHSMVAYGAPNQWHARSHRVDRQRHVQPRWLDAGRRT